MEHREILHVDMDAFFAAVEEKKDPTLKNLPLVIGMNNSKSVVSTANYCARKYGIHSAMPIYKAKLLCKDLIIREPHFSEYEDYHHRIIDLLRTEFTDQIEVCSIDECYLDITDLSKDKTPKYIALMIQNRIRQKIGLSCSIGIAHNKFLAKTATDLHKPNGITTLYRDELMEKFWPLKIEKMQMVGPSTALFLHQNNIHLISDLAKLNKKHLIKLLGANGAHIYECVHGISSDRVVWQKQLPKSISSGSTFYRDTNDENEITRTLAEHVQIVTSRLLHEKILAKRITLQVKSERRRMIGKSVTFATPTQDCEQLLFIINQLYEQNFINHTLRYVGVAVSQIIPIRDNPAHLFR